MASKPNCLFEAPYSTSTVEIKEKEPYAKNFCTAYSPEPGCMTGLYDNPVLDGRDFVVQYIRQYVEPSPSQVFPKFCTKKASVQPDDDDEMIFYAPLPNSKIEGFDPNTPQIEQNKLSTCFNKCDTLYPLNYGASDFQYPNRLWRDTCDVDCSQKFDQYYSNTLEGFSPDMYIQKATDFAVLQPILLQTAVITALVVFMQSGRNMYQYQWQSVIKTAIPIFLAIYVLHLLNPQVGNGVNPATGFALGQQFF